jgi:aryl carrier-like protein
LARKAGVATTVELRRWGPVKPGIIVHTPGRFVAVEEESGGDFDTWLVGVLRDLVGTDVDPERSFESYGLDSLAQIGLARRITVKIGRAFGVTDLADHPTINAVCKALQDRGPARTPSRAKVLCLHGFRTNKDIFHLQLAAILRTAELSAYDIVFVNAPRVSTGPHDPQIPREVATYEWWGVPQETYEDAWRRGFAGFEETRAYLRGLGPFAGVMGFSQGAAVAIFVQAAWTALFSAVMPPPSFSKQDQRPSFHCYDEAEPVADECRAMTDLFASPTVVLHHEGHRVSKSAETVNEFERFLKERSSVVTS